MTTASAWKNFRRPLTLSVGIRWSAASIIEDARLDIPPSGPLAKVGVGLLAGALVTGLKSKDLGNSFEGPFVDGVDNGTWGI